MGERTLRSGQIIKASFVVFDRYVVAFHVFSEDQMAAFAHDGRMAGTCGVHLAYVFKKYLRKTKRAQLL